jgi:chaperone BCS1
MAIWPYKKMIDELNQPMGEKKHEASVSDLERQFLCRFQPKTGDALLNAAMAVIMVSAAQGIGNVVRALPFALVGKACRAVCCLGARCFRRRVGDNEMIIHRYTNEGYNNDLYTMMIWYVSSEIDQDITGVMNVFRAKPDNDIIITFDTGSNIVVDYSGKSISVSCTCDSSKSLTDSAYITLKTTNGKKILVNFIRHVSNRYDQRKNSIAWKQKVHTISDNEWSGRLSNNKMKFENLALRSEIRLVLLTDVREYLDSEKWYEEMGMAWNRSYLLHGPPGCGKTSIIKCLSIMYGLDIYNLNLNHVKDDFHLQKLFNALPDKCMLVLEDIDCTSTTLSRDKKQEEEKSDHITLSTLLNLIDGVTSTHGRITVMTTNHVERVDYALVRPGRCDVHLHMEKCDTGQIEYMYQMFFRSSPSKQQLDRLSAKPPDAALSPAEICSIFKTYRSDPHRAWDRMCSKIVSAD